MSVGMPELSGREPELEVVEATLAASAAGRT
jgi:hypothetical protein